MASQAADLRSLLASGEVRLGGLGEGAEAPVRWEVAELAGRYVEICPRSGWRRSFVGSREVGSREVGREPSCTSPTAVLTAAVGLVRDAQLHREPVVWLTDPRATFFPPDVAGHGVDLGALAVVRVEELGAMLRAVDHLLRSGAFGLVVVDTRLVGLEGRRGAGGGAVIPLAAQVRLSGLTKKHGAALVCLLPDEPRGERGSLASLRAQAGRVRVGAGRFQCVVRALKDKRRGREWECEQVLRGPLGLR